MKILTGIFKKQMPERICVNIKRTKLFNEHLLYENRKKMFESSGIPLLASNESLSNLEINKLIEKARNEITRLFINKEFTQQKYQLFLDQLTSGARNCIYVKDFSEMPSDLKMRGYSSASIEDTLKTDAIVDFDKHNNPHMYIKFSNFNNRKDARSNVQILTHETAHALRGIFQNSNRIIKYKSERLLSSKQSQEKIFDDVSHEFEGFGISYMAKFKSVDDLQKKLNDSLNMIVDSKIQSKELNLETKRDWKIFYSYLHRSAREEKITYATDPDQTVVPFLYEVMENFLHNKRLDKYDDILCKLRGKKNIE